YSQFYYYLERNKSLCSFSFTISPDLFAWRAMLIERDYRWFIIQKTIQNKRKKNPKKVRKYV
ncbi:MAG: hypothetical protein KAV01_07100, partial [Candidatus Lokiarchaeota archaeon]|nr:hypothetical protein [Candidatus Lokiarchaeota archaeon]